MKRLIPIGLMIGMLLMLIISWKNIFNYHTDYSKEYNKRIELAEKYMEKEIYIDAVNEYEKALEMQPQNYDLAMKIVDLYNKLENKSSYLKACYKAIEADSLQIEPYLILSDYYIENCEYTNAYEILTKAKNNIDDKRIDKRLIEVKSKYTTLSLNFDSILSFYFENNSSTGYAAIKQDGKWGLLSSSNKISIKCKYDEIGLLSEDVIPVKLNDEYYYINSDEYRKLVPDEPAEYLGTFNDGYAPAMINGEYGYLDKDMQKHNFEYTYAGCFFNGIAAVEKDGKWGIIDTAFENVTEFEFDEILVDEYGFCSMYDVFFAKKDNKYYLYNKDGEKISDDGFEDAKIFKSSEAAAVKINDKWGFISVEGKIIIEPVYEDADSFNLGYAPFCENDKWGCIDNEGKVVISPTFDTMKSFSKNGYALVETNGVKKYIVINLYK